MFDGAAMNRLWADAETYLREPLHDWTIEWNTLAARAQELVCNDPFAAAMVQAKLNGTHGPRGLRLSSGAMLDTGALTGSERALRRQVEAIIDRARGQSLSADRTLTRTQVERHLDWCATVLGEGYAVRVWQIDSARHGTRYRIVRPERISNPDGRANSARLYHGLEFDGRGAWVAVWVETTKRLDYARWSDRTWQRVEVTASDGTPNVIRRTGLMLPGMMRGVSMFAPLLLLTRQVGTTLDAHVLGKRIQAQQPVAFPTEKPAEAAAAIGDKFAPLRMLFHKPGQAPVFLKADYGGADLPPFMQACHRLCCASWALPVEVVLCQMGDASLSSARAGLDQFDRTCQGWQDDHTDQVTAPIDRSLITEAATTGELTPGAAGIDGLCQGTYQRPPKYSTDRRKDADAAAAWLELHRAPSSVFAEYGYNYEDEIEQRARDHEFAQLHGVDPSTVAMPPASPNAPNADPRTTPSPNPADGAVVEDQTQQVPT